MPDKRSEIMCKFINIQQSTKTTSSLCWLSHGVSLSISSRVLKPSYYDRLYDIRVSLSISNRVLKLLMAGYVKANGVSLSISNRVLKPCALGNRGTYV